MEVGEEVVVGERGKGRRGRGGEGYSGREMNLEADCRMCDLSEGVIQ